MCKIDDNLKLVRLLLESDESDYSIAKETGMTRMNIGSRRKDLDSIDKMMYKNVIKLADYARKIGLDKDES